MQELEVENLRLTVSKARNEICHERLTGKTDKRGDFDHHKFGKSAQGRETWLVKVRGVDSIEDAMVLQGRTLLMLAADRPDLDTNEEFYVQELVGMRVRSISQSL